MEQSERGKRKTREGVVVSDKMDKTIIVVIERIVQHTKYKKRLKRRMRLKAHDAQNQCHVGDRVVIAETRPLSRDKRWALRTIVERAR